MKRQVSSADFEIKGHDGHELPNFFGILLGFDCYNNSKFYSFLGL